MTQPTPPQATTSGPRIEIDGIIDPGTGAAFVRITINSVLTSQAFAIPAETAEQMLGEMRRNVIDVVGSLKAEQKSKLIVPNGLLIPKV